MNFKEILDMAHDNQRHLFEQGLLNVIAVAEVVVFSPMFSIKCHWQMYPQNKHI